MAKDEKNLRTFAGYHHFEMTMPGKAGLEVGRNGKMLLAVWIARLSPSFCDVLIQFLVSSILQDLKCFPYNFLVSFFGIHVCARKRKSGYA